MRFRHQFTVRAPLTAVAEFHRRADSLPAITPPPLEARLEMARQVLAKGDVMSFTIGAGWLRIRWVALIEESSLNGFVDRQLEGPFASWVHSHGFTGLDPDLTEVTDRIEVSLRPHPFYGPVGLAMWLSLPILFAYRGWKTRRLLEEARPATPSAGRAARP